MKKLIIVLMILALPTSAHLEGFQAPSGYPYDRDTYGFRLSSGFNSKRSYGLHRAWDIALPMGTPLKSMMNGVVSFQGAERSGMYVSIISGPWEVQYMHLSKAELRYLVDGEIKRGQVVAYSGTSGESTGPHVHVVILYKGQPVNPDPYFKELI